MTRLKGDGMKTGQSSILARVHQFAETPDEFRVATRDVFLSHWSSVNQVQEF